MGFKLGLAGIALGSALTAGALFAKAKTEESVNNSFFGGCGAGCAYSCDMLDKYSRNLYDFSQNNTYDEIAAEGVVLSVVLWIGGSLVGSRKMSKK